MNLFLTRFLKLLLTLAAGLIFAVPAVLVAIQAISDQQGKIDFAMRELHGLEYISSIFHLSSTLEDQHGLSLALGNQNVAMALPDAPVNDDVRHAIAAVAAETAKNGDSFNTTRRWVDINAAISAMMTHKTTGSAIQEIDEHAKLISNIQQLMMDVTDASGLTADPDMELYYLKNLLIAGAPAMSATLGQVRAVISSITFRGNENDTWQQNEIQELYALYGKLEQHVDFLDYTLKRQEQHEPAVTEMLRQKSMPVQKKLQDFRKAVSQYLSGDKKAKADLSTGVAFDMVSDIMKSNADMHRALVSELTIFLQQRIDGLNRRHSILIAASSVLAFLFLMVLIYIYRNMGRQALTDQIRREKEAAEASNRAKSEFLANMSHELRTPLNSIMGMIRLLLDTPLNEDQQNTVRLAIQSSSNLLEIVNDILDLSKIEARQVELEHIGFDLGYILQSVTAAMETLALEKGLKLVRNYKSNIPYIKGDPTRIARILTNLIGNAIKYTDKGYVEVKATYIKNSPTTLIFVCEIIDTGIGIPPHKHESIFSKFVQADNSTTRRYGGTGLGLAITKQLVELMGGKIGLKSDPGKGSTFFFSLAATVTDTLDEQLNNRRQQRQCGIIPPSAARVIIAEDHPMNQIFVSRLMQKFGIEHFKICDNGRVAAEMVASHECDVVLMDCHMPEMNGYDATLAIRAREKGTLWHVPIVAMTANAMVGDREKCLRVGMDDYLSKPINADELKMVLGQWINFPDTRIGNIQGIRPPAPAVEQPVDIERIRNFADGDKEFEMQMVAAYLQQSDINMCILALNLSDGPNPTWVETAHMMKGGSAGIGADKLSRLCAMGQRMEQATAAERTVLFEQIKTEYQNTRAFLAQHGFNVT